MVSGTITLNCVLATCNAADVQERLNAITTINGETVDFIAVSGSSSLFPEYFSINC